MEQEREQEEQQVVHAQVEKPEDFLLPDAAAVTGRFVLPSTDLPQQQKDKSGTDKSGA